MRMIACLCVGECVRERVCKRDTVSMYPCELCGGMYK